MESYATVKGQIVIPSKIRKKYGIKAGTKIEILDEGERIVLPTHHARVCPPASGASTREKDSESRLPRKRSERGKL